MDEEEIDTSFIISFYDDAIYAYSYSKPLILDIFFAE